MPMNSHPNVTSWNAVRMREAGVGSVIVGYVLGFVRGAEQQQQQYGRLKLNVNVCS